MKKFLDLTAEGSFLKKALEPPFVPIACAHKYTQTKKKILEKVALGFKADKYPHLYFFNSLDEAQVALVMGVMSQETSRTGKNQFLLEATSSKALLELARHAKNWHLMAQLISPDEEGRVCLEHLHEKIGPKSALFLQRLVHPLLGTLSDQQQAVAAICQQERMLYHLDITGALKSSFWDLESIEADFVSCDLASLDLSGAVIFSKTAINEWLIPPQEPTLASLEAFLHALETLYERSSSALLKKISLKMAFKQALGQALPSVQTVIHPSLEHVSTCVLHFPHVHQEALSFLLQTKGIGVDLGGGRELNIAHLVTLLNRPETFAQSCVAISLPQELDDLDRLVQEMAAAYHLLLKGAFDERPV